MNQNSRSSRGLGLNYLKITTTAGECAHQTSARLRLCSTKWSCNSGFNHFWIYYKQHSHNRVIITPHKTWGFHSPPTLQHRETIKLNICGVPLGQYSGLGHLSFARSTGSHDAFNGNLNKPYELPGILKKTKTKTKTNKITMFVGNHQFTQH